MHSGKKRLTFYRPFGNHTENAFLGKITACATVDAYVSVITENKKLFVAYKMPAAYTKIIIRRRVVFRRDIVLANILEFVFARIFYIKIAALYLYRITALCNDPFNNIRSVGA